MFEVTESATNQLEKYFETHGKSPVRVYMASGCGGPMLALALDEQKNNDHIYDINGFQFLVDKSLMDTVAPIQIDHNEAGFKINSSLKVDPGACGSCTSC